MSAYQIGSAGLETTYRDVDYSSTISVSCEEVLKATYLADGTM
jgi:hypothetical protein